MNNNGMNQDTQTSVRVTSKAHFGQQPMERDVTGKMMQ